MGGGGALRRALLEDAALELTVRSSPEVGYLRQSLYLDLHPRCVLLDEPGVPRRAGDPLVAVAVDVCAWLGSVQCVLVSRPWL